MHLGKGMGLTLGFAGFATHLLSLLFGSVQLAVWSDSDLEAARICTK